MIAMQTSIISTFMLSLLLFFPTILTTAFSVSATMSPSSPSSSSPSSILQSSSPSSPLPPPIVYTIAGSDSGGGAGIQTDLHAIQSFKCHGCSAITCLTAQSSTGVTGVHTPPTDFLRLQLDTLKNDLYPRAIKIGMLGTKDIALEVGDFIQTLKQEQQQQQQDVFIESPFVVLDPVMISTSGHKLIQDETKEAIIQSVFPHVDIVTPNKFEAEELLGRKLQTPRDVEIGAREILNMGVKSVLIKGGHSLIESQNKVDDDNDDNHGNNDDVDIDINIDIDIDIDVDLPDGLNTTLGYAQDYFLSSEGPLTPGKERICDGSRGVWLRAKRFDSIHTHGTGCTLSSVIASALALGHQQRSMSGSKHAASGGEGTGATRAIHMIDACCLAKAYITEGVARGVQLGSGPGPVAHTSFPKTHYSFPSVALDPTDGNTKPFLPMKSASSITTPRITTKEEDNDNNENNIPILGRILPIVADKQWIEKLSQYDEITDIQLRIKNENNEDKIEQIVKECQDICNSNNVRLWINDYWKAAVKAKCFGVHVGQEDLGKCIDEGGLDIIRENNMALGISTHSYAELSAAFGINPSYISLGPVFGTKSKDVAFDPQGLDTVRKWKELIHPNVPLVAIGGINDAETVVQVKDAGADCVAVISAITKAEDVDVAVAQLDLAMKNQK